MGRKEKAFNRCIFFKKLFHMYNYYNNIRFNNRQVEGYSI